MAQQLFELEQFRALTWEEVVPSASAAIRDPLERVLEKQDGVRLADDERSAQARTCSHCWSQPIRYDATW